jgi:hypothetical protein
LAKKVLIDSEKLCSRALKMSQSLKFYVHFLTGTASQKMFINACLSYQALYTPKPKYREFTKHLPFNSVALGKWMDSLPGFTDMLKKQFKGLLEESKDHLT